jgi:predicted glutamine amidotransferase
VGSTYWDGVAFRIVKEPAAAARSARFGELCDTVRSRLVVAHLRKARHSPINTMTNTHPFTRTCCNREWVFAHNGLAPGVVELELAHQNLLPAYDHDHIGAERPALLEDDALHPDRLGPLAHARYASERRRLPKSRAPAQEM